MEELWHSILEFMSPYVIPDWGELIGLLPVMLGILIVLWFAWTIRRFATAGPTRRAPARVAPVAPAGLHMPGPSFSPVLGALGAAALVWGLVVGGTGLVIGVTILIATLLYWGREALRDYDHLTHADATALPAVVHTGPPPGVHMPGPSFRPILGAIGTAALFAGLVFGGWVLAAGVLILVLTLVGWLVDANAEYRERVRADTTGHLENPPAPGWPRRLFQVIGVLFAMAVLIQAGILPPRLEGGGTGEPGGSPQPSGPVGPPPAEHEVVALNIEFDVKSLEAPAGAPFTITFDNQDAPGVTHDIDIRSADGEVIKDQPVVNGGESTTYDYDPLDAGEYVFICSVHPIPLMTGTLTVR